MNAKEHCKRYEQMKSDRPNWDTLWDELSRFVHPNFDDVFGSRTPGEKKGLDVFDNTPTHANQLLASALHGMLTNPATYWFGLKSGIPAIDNNDIARKWFQDAAFSIHDVLTMSNFQTEIIEVYLGLGSIGTWVLYMEEDPEKVLNFAARPIYQSYISENKRGEVDTNYRMEKWTKSQILEKWGNEKPLNKKSDNWKDKLERKSDTDKIDVLHCVWPRSKYNNDHIPTQFKFGSSHILFEDKLTISESGFREFPYAIPRWSKVSGEVYGRSPANNCLADIKLLQAIEKVRIKSLQKTVDPPILAPDEGVIRPLKLIPGGVNYYRAGSQDQIRPLLTDARIDYAQQASADLRDRIMKAFYIDQLQLKDGPQMTATEVQRRTEQQLRLMGPILGRLHHELIRPIVDRVFAIMYRRDLLPQPIPEIIRGRKLQIQYSSLIAKAQRASEGDDITRFLTSAVPIFQAKPETLQNIEGDKTIRRLAKIYGIPEELITDEDDVGKMRDQMAQAQAEQQEKINQQHEAQITKDVGPTALEAAKLGQEEVVG